MYGTIESILREKGSQVHIVHREASIRAAVMEMNDHGIGALVVLEQDAPAGILSERDILRRVIGPGRDLDATRVRDVMTRQLVSVTRSMGADEAMSLMTDHRIRHLPVIEENRVYGIVSIGDLLRRATLSQAEEIRQLVGYITGQNT